METVVISLGGSIIVPEGIDAEFLKAFKEAILNLSKDHKIVVCTGGGHTAREYISVLKEEEVSEDIQDWMGIEITRINARLVASLLEANEMIPRSEEEVAALLEQYDIVLVGGLRPGQTSDGATAMIAMHLKAKKMVNITNVDGLYDKDPRKHDDAKFIAKISHEDFLEMIKKIGQKPGQHFVLDKVAAEITAEEGIEVAILKGVDNLKKYLKGEKFTGTVIN
ncbi:MAG: UMP kinase [Candidatus Woesearchaeota archaeon]